MEQSVFSFVLTGMLAWIVKMCQRRMHMNVVVLERCKRIYV